MSGTKVRRAAVAAYVAAMLAAPVVVSAGTIRQGDDYSQDFESVRRMRVCDRESDGRQVHSDFYMDGTTSRLQVTDSSGANNSCGVTGRLNRIRKHRVCEEIPARPDPCSSYLQV
jgi:hypothetical protein